MRNSAAFLKDGAVQFVQQKMLLPYYDVFDEQRYFEPAARQELLPLDGENMAVTICEDAWNDKDFWLRPLYKVDPVEVLLSRQAGVAAAHARDGCTIARKSCGDGEPGWRQ